MKADETQLLKFMNGPKQLIIPIYQRTYSWTLKECRQLWEDIIKAGNDDKISSHFLGSIVYIEKGLYQISTIPKLLLIDGQQRLATISLLLSALSKDLKVPINGMSSDKLNNYYLINRDEEKDKRHKLILTKSDKETLFKIIDHKELSDEDSRRIKDNYKFFVEQISRSKIEEVLKGLNKLIIIDVSLDRERDNPQLTFESLNSTGLELTQADLIRNYVLMGLEKQEQDDLYNDYWSPMEKSFGYAKYSALFDRFMRDYLTIRTGKIPKIKDVYSAFKLYAQNKNINEIVADVYKYSKYFVSIALEKEQDDEIKEIFSDINTLKVDVSYPFLLQVYEDYNQERVTKEEFIQILRYVESYVFRRAICGIPTNSLNKTFANLYKEIKPENYLESFKAVLLLKDSYRRFPRNEEFRKELIIKDVYNFKSRNYLLRKLENHNRKELVNVESYTIEHVMPQNENLSDEWKQELGENWKEIHDKYLHTIGNLTLTGYNSELSDKPFKEKRDMAGGFADSPIRLNQSLAKLEHWNEKEILNRAKILSDLAVQIWNCPELDKEVSNKYKIIEKGKSEKTYTIEDHPYLAEEAAMRPLFEELRKRILNLDSSVREKIFKCCIVYKEYTDFCDIFAQKSKLILQLRMQFDELNDPKKICRNLMEKNWQIETSISNFEELDYVMFLIKQAFDKVSEETI
ncbi:MAG: DUF262 and DUF1524 domain-containing protein [Caldisericota bacterium]|nr:DUF262 and DUF1524 domain-containing protein [Caldisericota bacterium]